MFEIPKETHCWMVEELSHGKHAQTMIFSRYIKFIDSLVNNKRPTIRSLFKIVSKSVLSVTGSNMRYIMMKTHVPVIAGNTKPQAIKTNRVYTVPDHEEWRIPLLRSLLELRNKQWEVLFDEEEGQLMPNEIQMMIEEVCIT